MKHDKIYIDALSYEIIYSYNDIIFIVHTLYLQHFILTLVILVFRRG